MQVYESLSLLFKKKEKKKGKQERKKAKSKKAIVEDTGKNVYSSHKEYFFVC